MRPGAAVAQAIRGFAPLDGARRRVVGALRQPWERDTLLPPAMAWQFPRFRRGFDHEAEAVEAIKVVVGHTMTKYDRCVTLHNLVRYIEDAGVDGAMVEAGVWRGGSAGIMALASLRYGVALRPLHLFDAWGDWPDPTAADGNCYDDLTRGELRKADNDGAFDACHDLIDNRIGYPDVHYHRGLFSDTLPVVETGPIAVLRLDADWYDGMRLCFDVLAPRLQPGGVIVVDDYGYSDGARRATDEWVASLGRPVLLHFVDYSCRYAVV